MAEVLFKVEIDDREADAKLRSLERRAQNLNVSSGTLQSGIPSDSLLSRGVLFPVSSLSHAKPGEGVLPSAPAPVKTQITAPSNALLASAVGALAANAASGSLRGTKSVDIQTGPFNVAGQNIDFSVLSNREIKRKIAGLRVDATANSINAATNFELDRNFLSPRQQNLGQLLNQARTFPEGGYAAEGRRYAAKVLAARSEIWKAQKQLWKNRLFAVPNSLKRGFSSEFYSQGKQLLGYLGVGTAIQTASAISDTVLASGVRDALESGNFRALNDLDETALLAKGARRAFDPLANTLGVAVGKAQEFYAVLSTAFGNYAMAKEFLKSADQYTGKLREDNEKLIALQDAWGRGFEQAKDAGRTAARIQSTNAGYRGVALGLRGGDLLDIDRSVYTEIATQMERRYAFEFVDKVPYPRMRDIQGDK